MIKCAVIGGNGFIGQHVVSLLREKNRKLLVIGRKESRSVKMSPGVKYLSYDPEDPTFWQRNIMDVSEVVLLAYATNPKTSFDNPVADITENLFPIVDLFQVASRLKNIKKVVLVSSGGAIYGEAIKTPISEEHETSPLSPYGITKLAIEKYALMYHHVTGFPVVIVRPSNAYGPGQKAFTGQGFVATVISSIILGKEVTIFGKNGTTRDYIFVTDLAEGIVTALEKGKSGQSYNLGSGVGLSNRQILRFIRPLATQSKFKIRLKTLPRRPFDVKVNILSPKKFTKISGWKTLTSFEQGIQKTWEWYLHQNNEDKK